jgi:hypothetical protein
MDTIAQKPTTDARPCSELNLEDHWDSDAIGRLIKRKTVAGRKPSFLFLGRREAELLRDHLGNPSSHEWVRTLRQFNYMGLEVVELEIESYLRTAGTKRVEGLTEALNRRPGWKDLEASSFWNYALR